MWGTRRWRTCLWLIPLTIYVMSLQLAVDILYGYTSEHKLTPKNSPVKEHHDDLVRNVILQDSLNDIQMNASVEPLIVPSAPPVEPVHVLIVTYQRSGSTFLGAMFDKNPEAFYMYEPMDAVYQSLYGQVDGYSVPSDIMNYKDGSSRIIPKIERTALTHAAVSILTCSMEDLPSEILLSTFHYRFRKHQSKLMPYHDCLHEIIPFYDEFKCSVLLRPICTERFNEDLNAMDFCLNELNPDRNLDGDYFYIVDENMYKNNEIILHLHNGTVLNSMNRKAFDSTRKRKGTVLDDYYDFITNTLIKNGNFTSDVLIGTYKTCMNMRRRIALQCLHHLKEPCEKAKIRIVKTIRMTLDNVLDITKFIPSLKIIYNLRSPLAIANSRQKTAKGESYMSMYSQQRLVMNEVELVCKVMGQDLDTYVNANLSHNSNIMLHQYENLCINISEDVDNVYKFIGLSKHRAVSDWTLLTARPSKMKALKWRKGYTMAEYVNYVARCKPYIENNKKLLWNELQHVPHNHWRNKLT